MPGLNALFGNGGMPVEPDGLGAAMGPAAEYMQWLQQGKPESPMMIDRPQSNVQPPPVHGSMSPDDFIASAGRMQNQPQMDPGEAARMLEEYRRRLEDVNPNSRPGYWYGM